MSGKHVKILKILIFVLTVGIIFTGILAFLVFNGGGIGGLVDTFNDEIANLNNMHVKTYSGSGISFNYPGSWQRETDHSYEHEETGSIRIKIDKNDSVDMRFRVEIDLDTGYSNQELLNRERNMSHVSDGYEISNSTLTVDGNTAYEYTMMSVNKLQKTKVVCFAKNGNTYYISFEAPNKDFDKEKPNFNLMLNSFEVQ